MSHQTLSVSTKRLQDTPGSNGLETQVDGLLSSLLNDDIIGFSLEAHDTQRRDGRRYDLLISYDSPGTSTLTSPFQLKTVTGRTLSDVVSGLSSFESLNPGYFYSAFYFHYIKVLGNQLIDPYIGFVVYSADPSASDNWKLASASGGGGGGSALVSVSETGISGATVVDDVDVDNERAVVWEVTVQDNNGNSQQTTIRAQHDGTTSADATLADYTVTGLPATGTVTGSFTVDINGSGASQKMRLLFTPTAGTWAVTGYRLPLDIATS